MTAPNLWIVSAVPAGPQIGFGVLEPQPQLTRSSGTGAGGWQIVDRPWRNATTEWVDTGQFALTMSLIMDTFPNPTSLESQIGVVESWELPAPGSAPPLPPILSVSGPVPHTELPWVVYSINWKDAIRDSATGVRYQQALDVVLWQYLPPTTTTVTTSPASSASGSNSGGSFQYTVKAGDTLPSIATAVYGNWQMWTQIAQLNSLRDPSSLTVGQVLQMPPISGTNSGNNSGGGGAVTPLGPQGTTGAFNPTPVLTGPPAPTPQGPGGPFNPSTG